MKTLGITAARQQLTSLQVEQPISVNRNGKPVMVLVPPQLWERAFQALEDALDTAAYDMATQDREPPTPWQELIDEIGWAPEQATAEEVAEARYWLGYTQ